MAIKKSGCVKWILVEVTTPQHEGCISIGAVFRDKDGGFPKFRETLERAVEDTKGKYWSWERGIGGFAAFLIWYLWKEGFFPQLENETVEAIIKKVEMGAITPMDYLCRVEKGGKIYWWKKQTKVVQEEFVPEGDEE